MTTSSVLRMPPGFLWGVATAAHQNEGNNRNNQWAAWEKEPGRIHEGQKAGAATNWWDLETAAADFDRAAELGLNSLRLSVEWSRIEPEPGQFDPAALHHYAQMIGLLRARGLEPMVTLHHFTDPRWLTEIGAWENPLSGDYFARYVGRVVEALGHVTTLWCTINEPTVYAYLGFVEGTFPPGVKDLRRGLRVLRHMLLAHGRAYRTIHRLQNGARVGLAHNFRLLVPANPASAADRRAAAFLDRAANHSTYEAITSGRLIFPLGLGQRITYMIDTCDYLGLNYYSPTRVAFNPARPGAFFASQFSDPQAELSDNTPLGVAYGEVNPHGLYQALKQLASFRKPIYITENGVPDHDDDIRARFIATHLAEAWLALQEGIDLKGYYHWTLVDNFEWGAGWGLRFGLYEFDPSTGLRTERPSAGVFGRIARSNGVSRTVLQEVAPAAVEDYFGFGT